MTARGNVHKMLHIAPHTIYMRPKMLVLVAGVHKMGCWEAPMGQHGAWYSVRAQNVYEEKE